MRRLLERKDRGDLADELIEGDESGLTAREQAMVGYAAKLTREPAAMTSDDVDALSTAGLTEREILDVTQVAAHFAYVNRMALGLGAGLEGGAEALGHHPDS